MVGGSMAGVSRSDVFVAKDGIAYGYGINHKSPVAPPPVKLARRPVVRVIPEPAPVEVLLAPPAPKAIRVIPSIDSIVLRTAPGPIALPAGDILPIGLNGVLVDRVMPINGRLALNNLPVLAL